MRATRRRKYQGGGGFSTPGGFEDDFPDNQRIPEQSPANVRVRNTNSPVDQAARANRQSGFNQQDKVRALVIRAALRKKQGKGGAATDKRLTAAGLDPNKVDQSVIDRFIGQHKQRKRKPKGYDFQV